MWGWEYCNLSLLVGVLDCWREHSSLGLIVGDFTAGGRAA